MNEVSELIVDPISAAVDRASSSRGAGASLRGGIVDGLERHSHLLAR